MSEPSHELPNDLDARVVASLRRNALLIVGSVVFLLGFVVMAQVLVRGRMRNDEDLFVMGIPRIFAPVGVFAAHVLVHRGSTPRRVGVSVVTAAFAWFVALWFEPDVLRMLHIW